MLSEERGAVEHFLHGLLTQDVVTLPMFELPASFLFFKYELCQFYRS